jgi:DegV family protein with EDD domain
MSKIAIITDSDSSISPAMAAKYGIILVPITIQFGEDTYTTNVDIDDKLLFEKIDKLGKLPTTAAPSPAVFHNTFSDVFASGAEEILCVCVSSKTSRTYESALLAASEFPEKKIRVVDSVHMTMGQAFQVIAAAEAIANGASLEEAAQVAEAMIPYINTYASFSTLKYLAMGGRIGKTAANMASMLDIRPILTMKDGTLQVLEKVRTRKTAMDHLEDLIVKSVGSRTIKRAAFYHVLDLEDVAILKERLQKHFNLPEDTPIVEFTPGLSVHAGSGMVGFVFYAI